MQYAGSDFEYETDSLPTFEHSHEHKYLQYPQLEDFLWTALKEGIYQPLTVTEAKVISSTTHKVSNAGTERIPLTSHKNPYTRFIGFRRLRPAIDFERY